MEPIRFYLEHAVRIAMLRAAGVVCFVSAVQVL